MPLKQRHLCGCQDELQAALQFNLVPAIEGALFPEIIECFMNVCDKMTERRWPIDNVNAKDS